jgi:hypothetical protein
MATITEKIQPRRRPQIFNHHDDAAIDAALARQEDKLARWVKYLVNDLAGAFRKKGGRKPSYRLDTSGTGPLPSRSR